ncbi:hypothetical protein [Buchnera aphidicola]|uniref:hypothetical protein n=1 Tax=Buchnera aphidicola TaxID=9 RepID=UPI0021C62772|nr:hypothetical protein [Buchnera aphidicola]
MAKIPKKKILIAMHAKTDKVYWAEYIKNEKMLWIGEKTESLLHVSEVEKKIKNFKNNWLLVGNGWDKINHINLLKFEKIKILYPNAKDIIPFSLFNIKNNNFLNSTEVTSNYLDNIF